MNDYELMLIISLVVVVIFAAMLIARINLVDDEVNELRRMVLDLRDLCDERNTKNLKHIVDIVDVLEKINKDLDLHRRTINDTGRDD